MTTTPTALAIPSYLFDQVVHLKISRTACDALIDSLGDNGHVRLTYDGEYLEIMSPQEVHELVSRIVAEMVLLTRLEWAIDITDLGSARFYPVDGHPFEPDGARSANMRARVRNRTDIDLAIDPPPDILFETDITTDSTSKLKIFSGMRVPEVWLFDLDGVSAKALDKGEYVAVKTSRVIAGLPIAKSKSASRAKPLAIKPICTSSRVNGNAGCKSISTSTTIQAKRYAFGIFSGVA